MYSVYMTLSTIYDGAVALSRLREQGYDSAGAIEGDGAGFYGTKPIKRGAPQIALGGADNFERFDVANVLPNMAVSTPSTAPTEYEEAAAFFGPSSFNMSELERLRARPEVKKINYRVESITRNSVKVGDRLSLQILIEPTQADYIVQGYSAKSTAHATVKSQTQAWAELNADTSKAIDLAGRIEIVTDSSQPTELSFGHSTTVSVMKHPETNADLQGFLDGLSSAQDLVGAV